VVNLKDKEIEQKVCYFLEKSHISLPLILFTEYKKLGLNEEELMLIVHLFIFQYVENKPFPSTQDLQKRMSLNFQKISYLLQKLIKNRFLTIEEKEDEKGVRFEYYKLTPLFQQLSSLIFLKDDSYEESIFKLFEAEFARPLSPLEYEILSQWLDVDKYPKDLIKAALKEAVFAEKLSFRYIDKILLDWQRKNIKNAKEAAIYCQKFRQKPILYQKREDKK